MKQRLLVMNGQRIVQTEQESGTWTTDKVDKAGQLKPGIYNLYMAEKADKSQQHDGVIVHVDGSNVYQKIGKNFVVHDRQNFDKVPEIGTSKSLSYDALGKVVAAVEAAKFSRGRSR